MPRFAQCSLAPIAALLALGLSGMPVARGEDAPADTFKPGFSVQKMDPSADPRRQFTRYAAGTWIDAMQIPADEVRTSGLDLISRRNDVIIREVAEAAATKAGTAPKGSPAQQVGDLYRAGMDEAALKELGNAPLKSEFDRIRALPDKRALVQELAHLALLRNELVMLGGVVAPGIRDKTRYIVVVGDEQLVLPNFQDYLKPEAEKYRQAYLQYVTRLMSMAGFSQAEAAAFAPKLLAMETRIARVRQPLVEYKDPGKRYVETSYAHLKALTPAFDWDVYFATLGIKPPARVTAVELKAMAERSAIIAQWPLDDLKTYLAWAYLRYSLDGLSTEFIEPGLELTRTYYGSAYQLPPRSKQVVGLIAGKFGHPLSRLYVEQRFSADSRKAVEDMVGRVRAEFRERLAHNTWLSAGTRREALNKLDKVRITVGYPDHWIDYSQVDVRPGDLFGSLERATEYLARRDLARFGGPVVEDEFANPRYTLPVIINAAYDPMRNAIEIPAAFLQPPIYEKQADAAVNFCSIGAVIGHEMTHGFDSGGRLYDGIGRARNWWTPADERRFVAQTQRLVKQANAYEVVPGLHANGALAVTENLADVGGISFAYGALIKYLKEHPEQDKPIDGLNPRQRCFLAWGQMWADKAREGYLRQVTATDAHAAGTYRAYAPAQHEPGFYEAFGIREGDPMWLPPELRVHIW